MVAHASLPNADLHECKGASAATVGKTIVASGSGTASFKYANPHGGIYFSNIGTPRTITYPSVYTKCDPTTTASGLAVEYTEATTAKLTYTGTDSVDTRVIANVCLDQAAGADRDIYFKFYVNGIAITGSETAVTTQSGKKVNIQVTYDIANFATNDYVEVYLKNNGASGDVNIYSFYLTALGLRG